MNAFRHLSAAAVVCMACHDSTGSRTGTGGITVGQPTPVNLAPTESSTSFTLHASTDSVYAVEIATVTGVAYVSVFDSVHQLQNAFAVVGTSTPDGERWTQTFAGPAANPWIIHVQPATPGQVLSTTITVHLVATGPEHIGSAVAFDSTISGESLDAYDDVDRFTFSGQSGRQVQILVQGSAPADPGQQVCMVLDTLTPNMLAAAVSFAGDTALEASSQVTLPRTGPYRIDVTSSRNGCRDGFGANAPYRGAYRIRVDTLP
jgi:hypothetical protein